MAPAQSKPCHFFRLPAELRNDIYELIMYPQDPNQTTLKLSPSTAHRKEDDDFAPRSYFGYEVSTYTGYRPPLLLAVSQQIRNEASKLFYSRTLFYSRSAWKGSVFAAWAFIRWFRSLSAVDQKLVKEFRVDMFYYMSTKSLKLQSAKALMEIFDWDMTGEEQQVFKLAVAREDEPGRYKYLSSPEIKDVVSGGVPVHRLDQFYLNEMRISFYDRYHGIPTAPDLFNKYRPDDFKPYRQYLKDSNEEYSDSDMEGQ